MRRTRRRIVGLLVQDGLSGFIAWVTIAVVLAGIGAATRGVASLLVLEEGAIAPQPVEVSGKWYVLRCDRKNPSRQIPLTEVKERVRTDLLAAKEREMATRLQERLAKKFEVEIVLAEIEKTAADATKKAAPETGTGDSKDSGKDAGN